MSIIELKNEINNDPIPRGYAGMTDEEVADSLNTVNREVNIKSLTGGEVYECLDLDELDAASDPDKASVDRILSLENIQIQGNAKTKLASIFNTQSKTRANLLAKIKRLVSRSDELGLDRVRVGHVEQARAI